MNRLNKKEIKYEVKVNLRSKIIGYKSVDRIHSSVQYIYKNTAIFNDDNTTDNLPMIFFSFHLYQFSILYQVLRVYEEIENQEENFVKKNYILR